MANPRIVFEMSSSGVLVSYENIGLHDRSEGYSGRDADLLLQLHAKLTEFFYSM